MEADIPPTKLKQVPVAMSDMKSLLLLFGKDLDAGKKQRPKKRLSVAEKYNYSTVSCRDPPLNSTQRVSRRRGDHATRFSTAATIVVTFS